MLHFPTRLQGRKARPKSTRSTTAAQNRHTRNNQGSASSSYSNTASINRLSNGSPGGNEFSNGIAEGP